MNFYAPALRIHALRAHDHDLHFSLAPHAFACRRGFEPRLPPEESQRYDGILAALRRATLDITKAERGAPVFSNRTTQPSNEPDTTEIPAPGASRSRIAIPSHTGRLVAFQNNARGREDAYAAGQWIRVILLQHPGAQRWCEAHGLGVDIMAAASTSPNTAGGALVPDVLSSRIVELRDEHGLFRQQADVVPMSSMSETFARRTGGLTAHFVGENVSGTESDLEWDNVTLVAKKVMVLSRMSSEISDDAIVSMADRFALEIALSFAELEDRCGFNGAGSTADGNIVGVLVKALSASHTMAKVAAATGHNLLTEIDADDLLALMAAVPRYALRGAAWYCSPAAKAVIFDAIAMAGGETTSQMLAERMSGQFLGYPIYTTPLMADNPATDYATAVMIGFGNLRQAAMIGSRREMRVALSPDRYFGSTKSG